jgi:hypothetical protein
VSLKLPLTVAIVVGAVCAAALVFAAFYGDEEGSSGATGSKAGGSAQSESKPVGGQRIRASGPVPTLGSRPRRGRFFAILRVRPGSRVPLLRAPGGRLASTLSARSEFGSARVLAVVRQRGSWFGVATPLRRNSRLGWVHFDPRALDLYWTRYSLTVRPPSSSLELRYGRRLIDRFVVTVGTPESATPPGRFGVTDALVFEDNPNYGCCALALSGHQENLPPGWLGGDRIAIHGTLGPVGGAASHGCIRATNDTMHMLFSKVPLGTPVFVTG